MIGLNRREGTALAVMWTLAVGFAAAAAGVRVHRIGGVRHQLSWPWMHWCLLDGRCRESGQPPRVYLGVVGLYVELPDPLGDDEEEEFDDGTDESREA